MCHRKYTPQPKDRGYPDDMRRKAIELYSDGLNFRRIARLLEISHQTVANWVNAHADR